MDLTKERILVTGGSGFFGKALVRMLAARGCRDLAAPRRLEYDLTKLPDIERLFSKVRPTVIFHLAARVGGIGANRANPAVFFYETAVMGIHMIEQSRLRGVKKFVCVGTVCAYPKLTEIPFRESDLWNGYPEETNAPYGLAKRMLLVQGQAYRQQYGFNMIYLMPVNLYGPEDHFNLETSHVIPAMIRKFADAKEAHRPEVTLWGDGSPTREFLYRDDAVRGLIAAAERYDGSEPVNLGTGKEISIKKLAELIQAGVGYDGRIVWDTSKPNGQPRRCLDTKRAETCFGFRAAISFEEGIRKTIDWYLEQRQKGQALT